MVTAELEKCREISHWKAEHHILSVEQLMYKKNKYFKLFKHLYQIIHEQCDKGPQRKNGEPCFIHPLNVVLNLKRAGIDDGLTLCVGILHDLIEDKVDEFQREMNIKAKPLTIRAIRAHEQKIYQELLQDIKQFCTKKDAEDLVKAAKALTRTKRTFYYQSIANLFLINHPEMKKRVIQVKLADRTHNILCIEAFNEQQRIYECFKALFLLNNTKKYLLETYGKDILRKPTNSRTVKLFKKCGKATYDAFLNICEIQISKDVGKIRSMLQLAFRKFAYEKAGLWDITRLDSKEVHLMRLFQGVIRKYDARLLQDYETYHERIKNETEYCKRFFADYHFSDKDIQAILDYKDAYSLKEVVAKLLYDYHYVLPRFLAKDLSKQGKIKG